LIRFWCGAHQFDLVVAEVVQVFCGENWYSTLTAMIGYLQRQKNLVNEIWKQLSEGCNDADGCLLGNFYRGLQSIARESSCTWTRRIQIVNPLSPGGSLFMREVASPTKSTFSCTMFDGLAKEERGGKCSAFGTLLVNLADGVCNISPERDGKNLAVVPPILPKEFAIMMRSSFVHSARTMSFVASILASRWSTRSTIL
jgi:hypothetical protein